MVVMCLPNLVIPQTIKVLLYVVCTQLSLEEQVQGRALLESRSLQEMILARKVDSSLNWLCKLDIHMSGLIGREGMDV